jgi:citrate synthase
MIEVVRAVSSSGAAPSRALVAAMMPEESELIRTAFERWQKSSLAMTEDHQIGLFYIAITPLLLAHAVDPNFAAVVRMLGSRSEDSSYVSKLFRCIAGRAFFSAAERQVFNAVLVSFHAGFGYMTPTILLARGAISTRVAIAQALAAGFTAAGQAHVGAVEDAMLLFRSMSTYCVDEVEKACCKVLEEYETLGRHAPGFGHPLFTKDPRIGHLRRLADALGPRVYLKTFDTLAAQVEKRFKVFPNIDSLAAAIFLSLGIQPAFGIGLLLFSRMADMLAHIIEKKQQPPFGQTSLEARSAIAALRALKTIKGGAQEIALV